MSLVTPAAGLVVAALVATGVAIPIAAAGPASALCVKGVEFHLRDHKRVVLPVPGTKITFTKPGTHTVEIVKRSRLTATYGTRNAEDRAAILAAVREDWPRVRTAVVATKGHRETFTSSRGERVTVTYGSRGDRVKWSKVAVENTCATTVLDSGIARFPRRNLDWRFVVASS